MPEQANSSQEGGSSIVAQIRPGMNVLDSTGYLVGTVKKVDEDGVHIDRTLEFDVTAPLEDVQEVRDGQVYLRYPAEQI